MAEETKKEKVIDLIAERKKAEIKAGFLNPLGEGTSYSEFLAEVEKSKKSIADYCNKKITAEELTWLQSEIEHYTNNQKD